MKKEFSKELKTVLKVAKWEYLLKVLTSLVIRGTLLIIPITKPRCMCLPVLWMLTVMLNNGKISRIFSTAIIIHIHSTLVRSEHNTNFPS
jgi:hypothetical protein